MAGSERSPAQWREFDDFVAGKSPRSRGRSVDRVGDLVRALVR
jgi:hypothetical protein